MNLRNKGKRDRKKNLQEPVGDNRRSNIHVIDIREEKEKENGAEKVLEETLAENSLSWQET